MMPASLIAALLSLVFFAQGFQHPFSKVDPAERGGRADVANQRLFGGLNFDTQPWFAVRHSDTPSFGEDTTHVTIVVSNEDNETVTAKAHIDRDDLFRRYVVEREGASSIASSMGVSTRVVTRRLNEHGIAQRSQSEANALRTLSDAARAKSSAAGKGRVTASETRAKIAAANRGRVVSEETRLLLANRQRGRPSYWTGKTLPEHVRDAFVGGHVGVPLSVEHRQKISASLTGHKHTPETRLKRSAAVSGDKNPRWGKSPSFGKWSLYTSGATGESQKMRSSWEVAVATGLDAAGIRWLYEPKRFTLTDRTYTPDFFLPDLGIYWEVKGWFQPRDQETIRRFRMECPEETLVVLTKPAIQMLTKERL